MVVRFLFIFLVVLKTQSQNKIANKVQPFEPNIISVELSMNEVKLSVLVSLNGYSNHKLSSNSL
jgi:hypothetical protein